MLAIRTAAVQDDPAADLTGDDLSSSGSVHLTHSATDFAALNQQPRARKNSAASGEIKKPTGKKKQSTWGFV